MPPKRLNESNKKEVSGISRLGIFQCDVKVLFLEVDLPYVAVFVSNTELEKRLVGVYPICLTHGISCKSAGYFPVFLFDTKISFASMFTSNVLTNGSTSSYTRLSFNVDNAAIRSL